MTDLEMAKRHKYVLPDGSQAINVTAISSLLDDGKSGAFAGAAVKLTKQGTDYRAEWKARKDRGTRVHGYCEAFLRGEIVACDPDDLGYVDAIEKWILAAEPDVVELEQIVLSEVGYGGRFDILARVDGQVSLVDLKTGSPYPIEHMLQLAAYRHADGIAVYDDTGALTGLRPLSTIERAGCLHVSEDGTYRMIWYPDADIEAWQMFCHLLRVYRWTRTDAVKAAVKGARS
ncbi:MAG: hypothetical protein ACRENM_02995 [Candidatus Dormibacteraceae bacterium]